MCRKSWFWQKSETIKKNWEGTPTKRKWVEWRRRTFIVENFLEDQNGAIENLGPSPPNSDKIWTAENCKTDSQNNSRELLDAARQSRAPHAYA